MWEVKYTRPNGSIDFMWYGARASREEAERIFRNLSEIGLNPITLRKVRRMPTNREYLTMRSEAKKESDRYQVITYSKDSGVEKKNQYPSITEAARRARGYVNGAEPLNCGSLYDGAIVYDNKEKCVIKAYRNNHWNVASDGTSVSLNMSYANIRTLDLYCPDWKEKLEGHFRLAFAKQLQHQYTIQNGGLFGIIEADGKYNDFNREIIAAMKQIHGRLYLGNFNYYSERREQICAGKESVYEEFTGQQIFDFHCSFAVPVKDDLLEKMIREWNKEDCSLSTVSVEPITNRIDELGGEHFIWF